MKITNFLISTILVGLVAGVFILNIADGSTKYGAQFDNETLQHYNKINELSSTAEKIKSDTQGISEKKGVLDVIGGFFSDAFRVLMLTKESFDTVDSMATHALTEDAGLGETGALFKSAIGAILIVLIFIGVILSAVLKKDM